MWNSILPPKRCLAIRARRRWAGYRLRALDATSICQPGADRTTWRLHVGYDLATGQVDQLELTDVHGAENLQRLTYRPGDSAALAGAKRLHFAPARRHGLPVATAFLQPVEFRRRGVGSGGGAGVAGGRGIVGKARPDTSRTKRQITKRPPPPDTTLPRVETGKAARDTSRPRPDTSGAKRDTSRVKSDTNAAKP